MMVDRLGIQTIYEQYQSWVGITATGPRKYNLNKSNTISYEIENGLINLTLNLLTSKLVGILTKI